LAEHQSEELARVRQDADATISALLADLATQKQSIDGEVARRLETVRREAQAEAASKAARELERLRQEAAEQSATAQQLAADLESQKQEIEKAMARRLEAATAKAHAEAAAKVGSELEKFRQEAAEQTAAAQRLGAELASQKSSLEGEFAKRLESARERAAAEATEKARSELNRVAREAAQQKATSQKLAAELEAQKRSLEAEKRSFEAELTRRLETVRRKAETDAALKAQQDIEQARREAAAQMASARSLSARLESQRHDMEADLKRQLQAQRKTLEADIEEKIVLEHRSKELATLRQLADARGQIDDLKRKLETSSRQLEGDVVEADLKTLLLRAYPRDEIRALPKRTGGADVHQRIYADSGKEAGSIIWECKNTATWQNSWLEKLRLDQRKQRADIAILVTAVRPRDCGRLEYRDGVWITEHALAVGVAAIFRSSLLQLSQFKDLPPDTAEKLAVIQRYLSSIEFRHRIEALVEAFQTMSSDLAAEKRSAERHWAQREKQLQLVVENISGMYGELRAVTGPTLARVTTLELPPAD
jgi:hypothetical protein